MTRKQFLVLLVAGGTVVAQPPKDYGTKEELAFKDAFNAWVGMANHNGMIVDAKEIRAWHETNHAWTKLKHVIDPLYKP